MRKPFVVISGLPGSGKTTLARRLAVSRESDVILQHEGTSSAGAILVSLWHLPGMPSDSGTSTAWPHASSQRLVDTSAEANLDEIVRAIRCALA